MSQPAYDCASIMEEAKALAEKNISVKAKLKAVWHTDIGGLDRRTMEKGNINFTLCKEVVVEHPSNTPASAKFLEEVAKGDYICWNAQIEQAKTAKASKGSTNQYPFQGRTFEPSHTFQPQLTPSWTPLRDAW